ncbi:DUF1016 family protein [Marinitoga sp. 1155]|uniref:DUF1016 family protein n=1 Tax=Marinitoga sp. 1155 TaxID=1428448 RepID=UPI0012E0661E|nr:DUF1016 family protein [Marinitoga sp. 1155]
MIKFILENLEKPVISEDEKMSDLLKEKDYTNWLRDLKKKLRENQLKAAVKANSKLFNFYWELGKEIVEKQKSKMGR